MNDGASASLTRIVRLFFALIFSMFIAAQARAAEKPNIVMILADDLGLDGVSCYGADKHKTPNVDKLAAAGTRFETCYAAPLCGPSRCALMTGRYQTRFGFEFNPAVVIVGHDLQGRKR